MTLRDKLQHLLIKYKYQLITLAAHVSFVVYAINISYYLIATLVIGWIVSNLVHSLYIHRIVAHRHFDVYSWVHYAGQFLFSLMNLGSPAVYAAVHINHHKDSGGNTDPHDPYRLGYTRTLLSLWDDKFSPNRKIFAYLLRDKLCKFYHTHHVKFGMLSVLFTPFLIVTAYWLSKIVILFVHIHGIGTSTKIGTDTSQNVWWLKPLSWGEELHNNHHLNMSEANHNFDGSWKQFDLLYYVGKLLSKKE